MEWAIHCQGISLVPPLGTPMGVKLGLGKVYLELLGWVFDLDQPGNRGSGSGPFDAKISHEIQHERASLIRNRPSLSDTVDVANPVCGVATGASVVPIRLGQTRALGHCHNIDQSAKCEPIIT